MIWNLLSEVLREPYGRKIYCTEEKREPYKLFFAVSDGKIVGAVAPTKNEIFHIESFAVLPEYQNKGIGTALIKELFEEAKKCGYEEIYVNSYDGAIKFYKKNGFRIKGKRFSYETYALTPMIHIKSEF